MTEAEPSHCTLTAESGTLDAPETDAKTFHWPDHITGSTLERMLLYLIENEGDDQITLHYRICVYTKAFFFLIKSPQHHYSKAVCERLKQSEREYKRVALASLGRLPFLSSPSLSLIQALLSGVGTTTSFLSENANFAGDVDAILGEHVV